MAVKEKTGGFISEFKTFIARGNVIDMAVGVIVGGAFSKISSSLVNDVVMPFVSLLTSGVNFKSWVIVLRQAVDEATPAITVNIGNFIATILDFLITALAVFVAIKVINGLHRKKEEPAPEPEAPAAPPEPSNEEKLLMEIRDLLKENK